MDILVIASIYAVLFGLEYLCKKYRGNKKRRKTDRIIDMVSILHLYISKTAIFAGAYLVLLKAFPELRDTLLHLPLWLGRVD